MGRGMILGVAVLCLFLTILSVHGTAQDAAPPSGAQTSAADPAAQAKMQQFMEGDSVFIENAGQWPDFIRFALDSRGANVGITDHGPRFQLFRQKPAEAGTVSSPTSADTAPEAKGPLPDPKSEPPAPSEMHEFALVFDGAAAVTPAGRGQSERKFNYLVGDASKHREGVGSFDAVWYENLYPGISLEMTGRRSGVKYNFHVAPGADCGAIRLRYEDIAGLCLTENGALEIRVKVDWEPLTDGAPYIYQEVNGEKRTIAGNFVLIDDHTYGFEVTGDYDATLPLVIDPEVEWSTYLGGTAYDYGLGIAVDGSGACYMTGYTRNNGWVSGGWDTTLNDGVSTSSDGYVVKLSSAGAHEWSTYLGGTGNDYGCGIAVDSGGTVYVTGYTFSADWIGGGWDTTFGGSVDGFVVKLNNAGGHVWSTYLGDANIDYGYGIAVDDGGACFATGDTKSSGWVSGGWDTSLDGTSSTDAFVVKLNSAGGHEWSTYAGGTNAEHGYGIAVDGDGACYLTGDTNSGGWVSGGWVISRSGSYEGYVVKLNSAGGHEWSTYLSGSGEEYGRGIAVDPSGACYAAGHTNSDGWVSGGGDTSRNGGRDGYVVKLGSEGAHLWSTYLGGVNAEEVYGIAVDGSGSCYVTGLTYSNDWTFEGWDTIFNDGLSTSTDGYVVKLTGAGTIAWSSYLGGSASDYGRGIAVDTEGANVWATGYTDSADFIVTGWQTVYGGNIDGFVTKIMHATSVGNLQVTLTPSGAVLAGAKWRRVSTSTWLDSGTTETDIPAGYWDIEFADVEGWITPEVRTVLVRSGDTVTDTGAYIQLSALQVTLVPAEAVSAGAQWRRVSTSTWLNSGDTLTNIVPGSYDIEFRIVQGWNAPEVHTVSVPSGETVTDTGIYTEFTWGIQWSTYLGGSGSDYGQGVAVDASGNGHAVGYTSSTGWTSGGWDSGYSGGYDAYVVKLDNTGTHLWSTYLGGTDGDYGHAIALDSSGNVYVAGSTGSDGWVSGHYDNILRGGTPPQYSNSDGFVVKLDATGAHLWSTYVGYTDGDDGANGIAVDTAGACYVTGTTGSSNWALPGPKPIDYDAFVLKLSEGGTYIYARYLGGDYSGSGQSIAVNSSGETYIGGVTDGSSYNAAKSGFVMKLDFNAQELWSTSIGGAGYDDDTLAIALDSSGNCYAVGSTESPDWISGGHDTVYAYADAYVVKLNNAGAQVWSTYLGGKGNEKAYGIAVDASGNSFVTGETRYRTDWAATASKWINGGWDITVNGDYEYDGFLTKVSPEGILLWSSFLGGVNADRCNGIALSSVDNAVWLTGMTQSPDWVVGGWQTSLAGGACDAFVAKVTGVNDTGSLQMVLSPESAAAAGAQWRRVTTAAWHNSGDTETGVSAGQWEIEFKDVYGYVQPENQTVSVPVNGLGTGTAVYAETSLDISWRIYPGGLEHDYGRGVALDSTGNCYATGSTYSSGWTTGGWDTSHNGGVDGYVVKLDSTGETVWSTYLGGSFGEEGTAIAVDADGGCYVTGWTNSSGWVSNGGDISLNGGIDGFVVKLSSGGAHIWSTYLGGNADDYAQGIAVDSAGNCCVAGYTESPGWVSGGWDTTYSGLHDGFAVKLNGAGVSEWSTYLGGMDQDYGYGIGVDANGGVYVAGRTESLYWISGGWDILYGGEGFADGYVVKFTATGEHQWSTYLGGTGNDLADSIAVNGNGDCYVTGSTYSDGWISGGGNPVRGPGMYAYMMKLDGAGMHQWSTYLYGSPEGIAVDAAGNSYVTDCTYFYDSVVGGWDTTHNGGSDIALLKLNPMGMHVWSSFMGGADDDWAVGVAVNAPGTAIWITGNTVLGTHESMGLLNMSTNAFVAKITDTRDTGGIQVTLTPSEAVAAGARWRRAGTEAWFNSGDTETGVEAGLWRIECNTVYGWTPPGGITVEVPEGGTTYATAAYSPVSYGSLQMVLSPPEVVAMGARWRRVGTTAWLNSEDTELDVPSGKSKVEFLKVTGWTSPPSQTLTVPVGGTASGTGEYRMLGAYLDWFTYLGNSREEYAERITVDSEGMCYITGYTNSGGWLTGGWDNALGGSYDAFVIKLDSRGRQVWSTYLGDSGDDRGYDIALDSWGNCYTTGCTKSANWVSGGWDTSHGGTASNDGFVVKLNSIGGHVWSTYIGGTEADQGLGIALDSDGNCYATGRTWSRDWTSGGWKTSFGGSEDAYVIKFNSAGGHEWSTYMGGIEADVGTGIAVDSFGNCLAAGYTSSAGWVSLGWDTSHGGTIYTDGYVVKFNSAGEHVWSTYLGATLYDYAYSIAVDAEGNCYSAGETNSNNWASGGWDIVNSGAYEGFVVKLNALGAHLWSTYLGDTQFTSAYGLATDPEGACYVTGNTPSSTWMGNTTWAGAVDAFVVKFDSLGRHEWSTCLGGESYDEGKGVAFDPSCSSVWVCGNTGSTDWGQEGLYTSYLGGGCDAFVAKLTQNRPQAPAAPGATAIGLDTITWTWQDHSDNETGFRIYAGEGDTAPLSETWTTGANVTSWTQDLLAANTPYTFQVAATNFSYDSPKTPSLTAWTLIEPVAGLNFSVVGHDMISVTAANTFSNLAGGTSGLQFTNTTTGQVSSWLQNTMPWVSGGLTPNTLYSFSGQSRNGVGVVTAPATDAVYTLGALPSVGDNIEPNRTPGIPYPKDTVFEFINPAGFGTSTHGGSVFMVSGYRYAWDTEPDHTFTVAEPVWNTGTLALSPIVSGVYYLHVQSLNEAGVAGSTLNDGPYVFVADALGAPVVSGPAFTNNPRPTWTWTSGGGGNGRYRYDLDASGSWTETMDAAFTPVAALGDGTHTLRVQERDDVGNWSADGSFEILVDTIPPVAPLVSGPVLTNNPRPTWTWTPGGGGNGIYRYELDLSGVWVETMEVTFTPVVALGDGSHILRVQERDDAGNWSVDGSFTVTVDTVAPTAPVVSGPSLTIDPQPTWTWTPGGGGNGTYRYDLDASGVWLETVDLTFTPAVGLEDGPRTLRVQERDDAGNWSADGSFAVAVDTVPPTAPVVSGPALTVDPRPIWTWTPGGGGNGTYRYDLDASGVWVETMDMTFTPVADLGEGSHTLRVQERDDAGNWSPEGSFEILVDTIPPVAPVVSGPARTNNPQPTWTWTPGGGGNGTYRHDLDASGVWLLTTGVAFTPTTELGDGTHTLRVQERDDAGNWSADGSHGLEINTTELTAAFSLVDPVETAADSVTFTVTFSTDVTPTFDVSVISVTGSLAGDVSIDGLDPNYKVTVTLTDPDADGTVGIAVAGGVVRDAYGNAYAGGTSPEYQIYNWREPWFTEIPVLVRKYTGDDHTFNALANCAAPSLTYQWNWRGNTGAVRFGPTAPSWTLTDLAVIQSGTLWCEASYDGMIHATPPVTLQVVDPLEIVAQPEGGTHPAREDHVFTVVTLGGYDPLHYQWRKDGTVIPEAPDSSSWTLTNLTEGHSGSYTVVVTDDNGMSVESLPADLVVTAGLAGPNAVLLASLILLLALFGGALLRHVVTR